MDGQVCDHRLCLESRKQMTVWGVTRVIHFEPTRVILETSMGILNIQGQELHLRTLSLDGGKMELTGQTDAMVYEEPRRRWRL